MARTAGEGLGAVAARRRKVAVGGRATTRPAPSGPILLDEPDGLHAGRFGALAPLLAVHLGAGTEAKRWPSAHWKALIGQYLDDGWRVVVVGGPEDAEAASGLAPHAGLRDWTGRIDGLTDGRPARAGGPIHRLRLRPGAPGGLRGDRLGGPLQRDEPVAAMAALVAPVAGVAAPRPLPPLPSEGLPTGRPPLHGGPAPRSRQSRRPALVGAPAPRGVAACAS